MKFCALFLALALNTAVFAAEKPVAAPVLESSIADRVGFDFNVYAGLDLQRLAGSTLGAVLSLPAGGVAVDYFFGDVFGVFAAVEYIKRGGTLNGSSTSANYIDGLLGVALRWRGNLFSSTSVNLLRLGVVFSLPLGDYDGTIFPNGGATNKADFFPGIGMHGTSSYPIGGGMWLGPISWIKYGLLNPVAGLGGSATFLNVGIGAQLSF